MRTQTIYRAMTGAYRTIIFTQTVDDFLRRKARQWAKFERELLRRMDERDALVAPRQVFLTPERIGQYMAGLSDDMKADDIFGGGK
jgi:hypothetical protein